MSGVHDLEALCWSPRRRCLALLVAGSLFCLAAAGCSTPSTPGMVDEPSLGEQAQLVRAGTQAEIRLEHQMVRPADLKNLADLDGKLQRINWSKTELDDAAFKQLCQIKSLVQLRLRCPKITDDALTALAGLPNLRHLHLIDAPLTDEGLAHLRGLTQLESLYIDATHASDAAIAELVKALPSVHLHVDGGHHRLDTNADDHSQSR